MIFAVILIFVFASSNVFAFVIPKSSDHSPNTIDGRHSLRNAMMIPSDVDLDLLLTTSHAYAYTHAPSSLQELASASLSLADADTVITDAETARAEFYFFFFAGSGAGGIGATQLPKFVRYITDNRSLDGVGPTAGGNKLDTGIVSSLVYPTLYESDVATILQKLPEAETIVARGNSEGYLASKGYIVREDYYLALEGCNPLAKSATYDALTRGTGDVLSPIAFQENLDRYRSSTDDFVADLKVAVLTKVGAFSTLSFLLAGLAWVIIEDARRGFF